MTKVSLSLFLRSVFYHLFCVSKILLRNLLLITKLVYFVARSLRAVCRKEKFHIINPLFTKLVWSRWLDIRLILFLTCLVKKADSVSISTQKKELGKYPAILSMRVVNNPYAIHVFKCCGQCKDRLVPPDQRFFHPA